jgi:hypothetical protein
LTVRWAKSEGTHTTGGIPRWSPTLVLVARFSAYVWQSGRDAQFSLTCGRMYPAFANAQYIAVHLQQAKSIHSSATVPCLQLASRQYNIWNSMSEKQATRVLHVAAWIT